MQDGASDVVVVEAEELVSVVVLVVVKGLKVGVVLTVVVVVGESDKVELEVVETVVEVVVDGSSEVVVVLSLIHI